MTRKLTEFTLPARCASVPLIFITFFPKPWASWTRRIWWRFKKSIGAFDSKALMMFMRVVKPVTKTYIPIHILPVLLFKRKQFVKK